MYVLCNNLIDVVNTVIPTYKTYCTDTHKPLIHFFSDSSNDNNKSHCQLLINNISLLYKVYNTFTYSLIFDIHLPLYANCIVY